MFYVDHVTTSLGILRATRMEQGYARLDGMAHFVMNHFVVKNVLRMKDDVKDQTNADVDLAGKERTVRSAGHIVGVSMAIVTSHINVFVRTGGLECFVI